MAVSRKWKLVTQENHDVEAEEVVLRIRVLYAIKTFLQSRAHLKCSKLRLQSSTSGCAWSHISSQLNRLQYMRQSVMLTGLSSPLFDEAIAPIYQIQDMFRR